MTQKVTRGPSVAFHTVVTHPPPATASVEMISARGTETSGGQTAAEALTEASSCVLKAGQDSYEWSARAECRVGARGTGGDTDTPW